VARESALIETVMFMREGRLPEALNQAEAFYREFPRNYLFQLSIAQILESMQNWDRAIRSYAEVLNSADANVPNYNLMPSRQRASLNLHLGNILDLAGRRSEAIDCYKVVLHYPEETDLINQAQEGMKKPYRK
jgi:tetratricopeptide (TPR) repeat protein